MSPAHFLPTTTPHTEAHTPPEIAAAFAIDFPTGLLFLLSRDPAEILSPSLSYWRTFSREWMRRVCRLPTQSPEAPADWLAEFWENRPLSPGWESPSLLVDSWNLLNQHRVLKQNNAPPEAWIRSVGKNWHPSGRVTLHLAENPAGGDTPFLFVATYVELGQSTPKHLPLARALKQAAETRGADALSTLLEPLRNGARTSLVLRELVESRAVYQAQAWSPTQARAFLVETPAMRDAGLHVKSPDWWQTHRSRPRATLMIGGEKAASFGGNTLLSFQSGISLGDQQLTKAEIQALLQTDAPLVSFKGQWVEVDRDHLYSLLAWWEKWETAHEAGIPLSVALRLLGGFQPSLSTEILPPDGLDTQATPELRDWLSGLKRNIPDPVPGLQAQLRAYQKDGVTWLHFGASLGLGLCLADDMGLGKTIQVIASWLLTQSQCPHLLVCPASLLGNWANELQRFAPGLPARIAHASAMSPAELTDLAHGTHSALQKNGVILTTYGMIARLPIFSKFTWASVTLDEAQAIKNAASSRARHAKALKAPFRLALTGTPIENGPADLWSLFDFLIPGWLGTQIDFLSAIQRPDQAAALRKTINPLMLRRKKNDPSIAPELPEKLERLVPCSLTRRQAALYGRAVQILRAGLSAAAEDPAERKGLVLQTLLRLKQICDHPSLFAADGDFQPHDSGKCLRLARLAQTIASQGEKLLVFTQFRAMMEVIDTQLREIYHRPGLSIHGGVPAPERMARVAKFQKSDGPPYFVISLMAGGTGLNLTAATHVIHFDRWWNPAVERQATDRAYRIGQTKKVTTHTFLCTGTFEDKLDKLLRQKTAVAKEWLDNGETGDPAPALWQMSDAELLSFLDAG